MHPAPINWTARPATAPPLGIDVSQHLRLLKQRHPHLTRGRPSSAAAPRPRATSKQTLVQPAVLTPSTVDSPVSNTERWEICSSAGDAANSDAIVAPKAASDDSDFDGDARPHAAPSALEVAQKLATAVEQCPHCQRRFSVDAASRHIPICSQLRSRPKPPRQATEVFTDNLGRRHGTHGSLATTSRPASQTPSRPQQSPAKNYGYSPAKCASPAGTSASTPSRRAPQSRAHGRLRPGELMDAVSGRNAAASQAPPQPAVPSVAGAHHALSLQWGQLQFLLSDGLEALNGQAAILDTQTKAQQSLEYLDHLEAYSEQLGMRKGALSRLILPFDVETNSNDQASTAGQVPKELASAVSFEEAERLVASAINLRKLIRVKVADCRDVEQAREALRMLVAFLGDLRQAADAENVPMTALLREL